MNTSKRWREVPSLALASENGVMYWLYCLASELDLFCRWYEFGSQAQAMIVPVQPLLQAAQGEREGLSSEGDVLSSIDADTEFLMLSARNSADLLQAISSLVDNAPGFQLPSWLGLSQTQIETIDNTEKLLTLLKSDRVGTLYLSAQPKQLSTILIYPLVHSENAIKSALARGPRSVFEDDENLSNREDWFKQRSSDRGTPSCDS